MTVEIMDAIKLKSICSYVNFRKLFVKNVATRKCILTCHILNGTSYSNRTGTFVLPEAISNSVQCQCQSTLTEKNF